MAVWILFLINLFAAAAPLDIRLVPEADSLTMIVRGEVPAAAGGAFSGSLSLNGSSAEVPVSGVARVARGGVELSMKMRYRDVPEDWANRLRARDFDYRLRGRVAGGAVFEWSGTRRWNEVTVEKREDTKAGLMKLGSIEMTEFSLLSSAGRADIAVRNPLSFPLKIASTSYRLLANGRDVGSGSTAGMLLRPDQTTDLRLPIDFDHGQLLAAAGSALQSGGEIQGRLLGTLVVRMPSGDISVPLDLSGHFSPIR